MSFLNILGVGDTAQEAEQDLINRVEMANGMNLVVSEIFTYTVGILHHAAARMCSKEMKQAIDKDKSL